ncbi:MAG TPA: DNA polymerase III subunit alpha [Candidatus Competibacteraceae bacterium]|nr:DNA polymerase III subunit alpha [Candidatus Competibacteraceae bacterium]
MSGPGFVHLHLHTEFSLVDGLIRVKDLVKAAAKAGMPACAVTDMSNLFALIKFYKAAQGAGIKPIVGAEVWVQRGDEPPARLVLLCRDREGYLNLTRLISRGYVEGQQKGVPVLQRPWLTGHSAGLIALSAGREGEVGRALLNGNASQARVLAEDYKGLFPEAFYLELMRTGRPGEEDYIHAAVELALEADVPVVASNDVRFLKREDFEAHEARVCIHDGRVLADPKRPRHYSEEQYLKTPAEMAELFADLPEALENSVEIARRCNVELKLGKNYLPDFPVPEGMTTDSHFALQAREGLERRLQKLLDTAAADYAERRQRYEQRLETEIQVIIQMGFAGYFLIVADFIQWAKQNGVPVGPGRGSGAGSLVAFALGITDLDPLPYDLLFERFLNPERVSMPDFDVDFCMEGRDRVIDYVARKYGRDKVSQIATHGSMAAKAVVRDVGRVLGHPYGFVDKIAKLIPFELGITLDKALEQEEELRKLYQNDEEVRALIDLARKLEGLSRSVGKHAGGVVIAPSTLTDFSPLYCEEGSTQFVTQFDKDDVEAAGLVKFDFLGLRTLTIIDWALETLNRQRAERGEPPLDISDIPLDDAATYGLLKRCETTAVFQLESRGMKDLIRRLQPDCFEDIVALVALFRPGPLQSGMVDDFINRKHGRARVEYPHPDLEPILRPTYGVIVYQEQVMQIAQVLAGYTLGGADLLRRAMGKKKPEEMAKQREIFVAGALGRGVDGEVAGYIFDLMEKFAGYGFNKSHSAAYALVSYQTAWLKQHYPAAFMAAVLSSDMDKTDKVVVFIEECRNMGLAVVPPSVNGSDFRFTVDEQGRILYGLGAIKGVGENAIGGVLEERRRSGAFHDLYDFCRRIDLAKVNRRVLEALIRAGACDCLGGTAAGGASTPAQRALHRACLMAQLPEALQMAEQHSRNQSVGQVDLFGMAEVAAPVSAAPQPLEVPAWSEEQVLAGEKETLGLYLTGHPIDRFEGELRHFVSGSLALLSSVPDSAGRRPGRGNEKSVVAAGLVVGVRIKNGPRGRMAFVTLDDRTARMEIRVFAEVFERYRERIAADQILVVKGTLSYDEFSESMRLNAEALLDMDAARDEFARRLVLSLDARQFGNGLLDHLAGTLAQYRNGNCPVWVDYRRCDARADLVLGPGWRVVPADALLRRLRELVGEQAVKLDYA